MGIKIVSLLFLALSLTFGASIAFAQTASKPSGYHAQRAAPDQPTTVSWLAKVPNRAAFDRLARIYEPGTARELPHLLFLIDRGDQDRVYFINTRRYALHTQFLRARRLARGQTREAMVSNYRDANRRFLLGTLAWQRDLKRWTYEFWEGDRLTEVLLSLAQGRLRDSFFAPIVFKANATFQEEIAQQANIAFVTQQMLIGEQTFAALNSGIARGRLHFIDAETEIDELEADEIAVLSETPLSLPPVAGVITARPSTTLSHVNLLAKGWGIPNVYIRDALTELKQYDQRWVELRVSRNGYRVRPIEPPTTTIVVTRARRIDLPIPKLVDVGLKPLHSLRFSDRAHCGAKAANLGVIANAIRAGKLPGVAPVPFGFCIPFVEFANFVNSAEVRKRIADTEQSPGFATSRVVRARALELLRGHLAQIPLPEKQTKRWTASWNRMLRGAGVFVRSSSNSEDLPNFSGAGLYTTVPNVREPDALPLAVKQVWASIYNTSAYEARRVAGVPHDRAVMAVMVQQAVDAASAGVLVTADPFDPFHRNATYISAKHGLGIRVVEGKRQAEQVLFDRRSGAVQVLTHSDDSVALLLDENGGVREQAIDPSHAVLTDSVVRRLAQVGEQIKRLFGGRDQDIEWAIDHQGQIVVLQARPFVVRSAESIMTDPN